MRYKLSNRNDELVFVQVEDEKMPVRAEGFLQFEGGGKELFVDLRNGKILIWVAPKPVPIPRRK